MTTNTLPETDLIRLLSDKAAAYAISFDFLSRLKEFRDRVCPEVRHISQLFDEYTPHDEQYHLKRLFTVADMILGKERMDRFNVTELFILAASLYGHDWGMAVSKAEKQVILTGKAPDDNQEAELWTLPDERARLKKFAKENGIPLNEKGCCNGEMPTELWREYVRQTHAFRSGERVRRYFEHYNQGVAIAIQRVCVGHWLDFENLENYTEYPSDFAVLGQVINLRALAVYVRLIDLLDLAEDRTPYVIWKFVAPRDPMSKMEWEKHRALQPVVPTARQEGRTLLVEGHTADYEVFAALEDLKAWVNDQFRGCNDLLARMNDPRHRLDIYNIDWRIIASGFEPISIQFEFDRGRMFEILSQEIYQGDPYVFLRELLQNSIDAIRMRREVLERSGLAMAEPSIIRVHVEHKENGDALITWSDDGVGMDESIVRNYLAVAGRSYYRSEDFEREGLKMEPISRFGVGILSCFMVGDRIEIDTFREPYLLPTSRPLKIAIPAVERRFRIEVSSREDATAGTTVRVFVKANLLAARTKSGLKISEYLKRIAGFSEFPIAIWEGGQRTLILSPYENPEPVLQKLRDAFEIHRLALSYDWEAAFLPQDIADAQRLLQEKVWDVARDIGASLQDGVIVYLVPINPDSYPHASAGSLWVDKTKLRFQRELFEIEPRSVEPRSLTRTAVFRDGILLPRVQLPAFNNHDLPKPHSRINLRYGKPNLARTTLLDGETWDTALRAAFVDHIVDHLIRDGYATLSPRERFKLLGSVMFNFGLRAEEVLQRLPHCNIPLLILQEGGEIEAVEWQNLDRTGDLPGVPQTAVFAEALEKLYTSWSRKIKYEGALLHWAGEPVPILNVEIPAHKSPFILVVNLATSLLEIGHVPGGLRPLAYPQHRFHSLAFLPQDIFMPVLRCPIKEEDIIQKAAVAPLGLDPLERNTLAKLFSLELSFFSAGLAGAFSFGKRLNVRHPAAQGVLRIRARAEMARRGKSISAPSFGKITDAISSLFDKWSLSKNPEKLQAILKISSEAGLWEEGHQLSLKADECHGDDVLYSSWPEEMTPFGEVLT
jgi:hypothetical protein